MQTTWNFRFVFSFLRWPDHPAFHWGPTCPWWFCSGCLNLGQHAWTPRATISSLEEYCHMTALVPAAASKDYMEIEKLNGHRGRHCTHLSAITLVQTVGHHIRCTIALPPDTLPCKWPHWEWGQNACKPHPPWIFGRHSGDCCCWKSSVHHWSAELDWI